MNVSPLLALVVGLFSALHCIGMCGGIMGALSFSLAPADRADWRRFSLFLAVYNLGRIGSYALAGAFLGWLGGSLMAASHAPLHDVLRWLAALIMVGIGLHVAGWFPQFARVERIGAPLWRRLEPLGRRLVPVSSLPKALAYGAVWGWLPCGLVYTMLISAPAQASPLAGATYMAMFGLGTLPTMMATGLLAGRLYRYAKVPHLRVFAGLTILILGVFTLVFESYN